MVALWYRADHYIFALLFLFSSSFFFSSPNLSSRRLDVCHTWCSLIANLECSLKRAARGSLKMQDAKKSPKSRHLRTIVQLCRAISSQLRHVSTIGKKNLLSSNISSSCPQNMVNFALLAAEIGPVVWGPQLISTAFASWQRYCTAVK